MMKIIGVRFKKAGKIYYFDPQDLKIKAGDNVIVETSRGVEYGSVVYVDREIEEEALGSAIKPVIRVATPEDDSENAENEVREKEAFDICLKKIEEHGLKMKLISTEYTFDNKKVIFYFTADGRVDFRELVKDLASIFRMRIELRQIGVRDEAKLLGGIGPCGKALCCATFLGEFHPVSIKMAKDQDLSLNPAKISGLCGRLMCCLKYEHETYEEILSRMPVVGMTVHTPVGKGTVVSTSTLNEMVKVKLRKPDKTEEILPFLVGELDFDRSALEKNTGDNIDVRELIKSQEIDKEEIKLLKQLMKEE